MSKITKLEPAYIIPDPIMNPTRQRVAAYARVSTNELDQLNSLEAQVDYYEKKIADNVSWVCVGIYVDAGITGTSYSRRTEFQKMIADCKDKKIDCILTKSVSRFARNTIDALNVIRELKDIGVGIFFERENVWTLDSKGEFLITLLTSLAQEEARSISENTAWGLRKRFADGKYSVGYRTFLGYDYGFAINEEQAIIVKIIFKMYLQGYSTYCIAQFLEKWDINAPAGGSKWHASAVQSILKNEKYKGDAMLQKSFTTDFLTKKVKKNEGELPKYYVHDGHEGIVDELVFDYVQEVMKYRNNLIQGKYSGKSIKSSFVRCGVCGAWYGPKPEHSNDKYRKDILMCRNRFKKPYFCKNTRIPVEDINNIYIQIVKRIYKKYPQIKQLIEDTFHCLGIEAEVLLFKTYSADWQDISIVIKSITAFPNGNLKVELIDGTQMKISL